MFEAAGVSHDALSIAAVSLGYRSPKDGNAQRPKSRLTRDELFTSLD